MKQPATLIDPYGLRIAINDSLCSGVDTMVKDQKLYNDYRTVIEHPAFIIDLSVSALPIRYYFRSLGWGAKLLIKVEKLSSGWQANRCNKNPSDSFLHSLARQGNILSPGDSD